MNWRIPLSDLDYDEKEQDAVLGVLRSKWLTMGSVTQSFEEQFAAAHQAPHALALTNATVALHLACLAGGLGPGDEAIVPALTFVASANAVLYTGADVRFADVIGPQDLNISPESVEAAIGPRTRAIVCVHYGGYPCRMPELVDIARRHNLFLIEDAAHAPGASLEGRSLGLWGDAGCFSFFSNKNLSTGEGGMLITSRDDVAARVRTLRSHGMTSLTWDRHQGHAYTYDVTALGYNYRIDEIHSALGCVQLGKLAANNERRRSITERYWSAFEGSGLDLPFKDSHTGISACHIFPILLPEGIDRLGFIDRLRAAGIQTSIHYPPVHKFSYYQERYPGVRLPVTEALSARQVTLPLYPTMRAEEVETVIASVLAALD